jgi:serine/threonine protein kinase
MDQDHPFVFALSDRVALSEASPLAVVVRRFLGGFGEVYVLRDESPPHSLHVAKTPRSDLSEIDQAVLDQFVREALTWAKLPAHPNVLELYGVRAHGGRPFARMPFVPSDNPAGASLAAVLASAEPGMTCMGSVNTIAMIGSQLIHALADLEGAVPGFVHGDLKPANLLLRKDAALAAATDPSAVRLLISDFGLSRSHAAQNLGSPLDTGDYRYLAPECFEGVYGHTAQDIYALGCTLFELTVGYCYQIYDQANDSPALLDGGYTAERMAQRRPDMPQSMLAVIWQCLRPDPAGRPASFAVLAALWREAVTAAGGKSIPVKTASDQAPPWTSDVEDDPITQYLIAHRALAPEQASWAVRSLADANKLSNLQQYAASAELAEKILAVVPAFGPALAVSGYRLARQNKAAEAIAVYAGAMQAYVREPPLLEADRLGFGATCATLAQLLLTRPSTTPEIIAHALSLAELAIGLLPDSAKAHLAKGLALLRSRDAGAVAAFQQALERDPSKRQIRLYLGAAMVAQGAGPAGSGDAVRQALGLTGPEMDAINDLLSWF